VGAKKKTKIQLNHF